MDRYKYRYKYRYNINYLRRKIETFQQHTFKKRIMINTIRKLINFYPKSQQIHLGRWAIKKNVDECNKYMIHLHAEPGYIDPFRQLSEKYINLEENANLKQ